MRKSLSVIVLTFLAIAGCKSQSAPSGAAPQAAASETPSKAPARPTNAIVLFDGADTSAWQTLDGKPCPWIVSDGAMEVHGGNIISKEKYNDCVLHVEFMPPVMPEATGQAKGNSGVYLQGHYEVQVLDSYGLISGKGDCGAIYSQKAPDINVCKPPGQWQTYDITFVAPQWSSSGERTKKARITVYQNGTLIHKEIEIDGSTAAAIGDKETPGAGPVMLQDHGNKVRYRNIWIVPK